MTWRSFLFAADALMKEEGLSFHVETETKPAPSPAENRARNADAMKQFQALMGGVQRRKR